MFWKSEFWGQDCPSCLKRDRGTTSTPSEKSGTGKTTLLRNLILQDIDAGGVSG